MSTSVNSEPTAQKIWFDEDDMWVLFKDGKKLSVPLVYFPRLLEATKEQREKFEIFGEGFGVHWPDIDEDICIPNLINSNIQIKKAG